MGGQTGQRRVEGYALRKKGRRNVVGLDDQETKGNLDAD